MENLNSVDWSEIFNYVIGSSSCWSFYRFRSSSGIWISISFVYIIFRFRFGKIWNFVFFFQPRNCENVLYFVVFESNTQRIQKFFDEFWLFYWQSDFSDNIEDLFVCLIISYLCLRVVDAEILLNWIGNSKYNARYWIKLFRILDLFRIQSK